MLSADQAVWEETIDQVEVAQPFTDQEVLYVQDQNNGSYSSGQVQIDTSPIANSMKWVNWQESYLELPFMVTIKSDGNLSPPTYINSFVAGLKSGYYQIIESMQVDLNNQNICQLQGNLNLLTNYKVLTSFSQDDLNKLGPILGVYPDTSDSYTYSAGASASGDGYANNRNAIVSSSFTTRGTTNSGFLTRQKNTTALSSVAGIQTDYVPTTGIDADAKNVYDQEGTNYQTNDGLTNENRSYSWIIVATIRMKDLADFFDKAPLMRGAFFRITINCNTARTTVTTTTSGSSPNIVTTLVTTSHVQLSGRSNPVMLASSLSGSASNTFASAVASVITIESGLIKTSISNTVKHPLTACRLYVTAYKLDPVYQTNLLESKPFTTIKYLDYYTYTVSGVSANQSFNTILTNGIVNPKALIVMPFANKGTAGSVNALNLDEAQMLFDSAPGTTVPYGSITNFQVQLSGENLFMLNEQYTFSQFMDEFQHIFALNGSETTGINSGLISYHMWRNAYRYYVANLSRRNRVEDAIPKSVMISGTNNTKVTMDYVCFILFEKSVTMKTATGEIA